MIHDPLLIGAALWGGVFAYSNCCSYMDARDHLSLGDSEGPDIIRSVRRQRDIYKSALGRISDAVMEQPGETLAIRLYRK